jgi:ribonuclease HI
MIQIWTDGSGISTQAGAPCGCGIILIHEHWRIEAAYYPGVGTHNVAELKAILIGLRLLDPKTPVIRRLEDHETSIPTEMWIGKDMMPVRLYSDSQYALNSMLGKFGPGGAHQVLVARCQVEARKWHMLSGNWVRGHAEFPHNERADQLAAEARKTAVRQRLRQQGFVRFDVFMEGQLCMDLERRRDPQNRWEISVPQTSR